MTPDQDRDTTTITVTRDVWRALMEIKLELGKRTLTDVIALLLTRYGEPHSDKE